MTGLFSPSTARAAGSFARVGPGEKWKYISDEMQKKTKEDMSITMPNTLTLKLPYPLRHLPPEIKVRCGRFDAESKTWSFPDNARRSGGN